MFIVTLGGVAVKGGRKGSLFSSSSLERGGGSRKGLL